MSLYLQLLTKAGRPKAQAIKPLSEVIQTRNQFPPNPKTPKPKTQNSVESLLAFVWFCLFGIDWWKNYFYLALFKYVKQSH